MPHSYDFYADWVQKQILGDDLKGTPSGWIDKHRDGWRAVLAGVVNASGVFEVPALVISRWEFLGGLYRGNTTVKTDGQDAIAYAGRFLTQVNPDYAGVHNYGHRPNQNANQSDLFSMFRNKPLHGVHPAGINMHDNSGVLGWLVDLKPTGGTHLTLVGNNVHIDGSRLISEFLDSMTSFSDYLNVDRTDNQDVDLLEVKTPQERWLRAHWARYCPHGWNLGQWMTLGLARGIPA
jgi:hypothetical protein